jgi:hypothetical protein
MSVLWKSDYVSSLGAFAKLPNVTISFVMSVRLSVCPHRTTRLPLVGFSWKFIYEHFFSKIFDKTQFSWKPDKNDGTLREDLYTFVIMCRSVLFRMKNVSDKSCREIQNSHFMFSSFFLRKSYRLWDNVQKYGTARQATDDNMAHAYCMLDT